MGVTFVQAVRLMSTRFTADTWITKDLRDEAERLVEQLTEGLQEAIGEADRRPALPRGADDALVCLQEPLPEDGSGLARTIEQLVDLQVRAGANTAGPRCFHFVIGGNTPAAQAADILASAFDIIAYTWAVAPLGVQMELQALDWLKELLGLPASMAGVMVTGATMANFTGLVAARQWWGEQLGIDVSETGIAGLPQMPVLTSGYVHAATRKVLALQGIGRGQIRTFSRDEFGRVDFPGLAAALADLDGAPAVIVVNAGEVNAGDFDPLEEMIGLARQHNCWVHVDGAFGLFAALSPRTAHLVRGIEQADSVTVDGHKWLNVPYDSGYAFVRDHGLMARAFRYSADYLPAEDDPHPTLGAIGPESSRRGRGLAVWATLKAYGRKGHRRIVEHCLDMARYCAELVRSSPDLELMAEVQLNIVPFRYNPADMEEEELDRFNEQLGQMVLDDGRFLVGTSKLGARTIFRPAFSNWRTRPGDIEEFVAVVRAKAEELRKAR
jgi:glutamate/tyrosine decarboxylase-like PLP-dependent enzyme